MIINAYSICCIAMMQILFLQTTTSAFMHNGVSTRTFASQSHLNPMTRKISRGSRSRYSTSSISTTELMMEQIDCDVAIVGGGPAGCTCALYTSRGGHKTVIIDKNPAAGALAITSTIANYPGVDPTMSGEALLDNMRQQAVDYGADYHRNQVFMVDFGEEIENGGDGMKTVYTPDLTVRSKVLVLATGALGRTPAFKGEGEYLGKGVSYCATCDGAFYQESPVAVVGVTQEAMEEAEFLTKFASTVHWITPTPLAEDDVHAKSLLAHENVKQWVGTRLLEVQGDASGVTGIDIKQRGEEEPEHLDVEGVFIYAAGSKPITDYISSKIEFEENGGVSVNTEMATNIPGVYAIGDIRNTPFKQVVVAAGDGCIAAMSIDRYLKGRKSIKVDWIHQ